jgi:hypothetical protein
LKGKPHAFESWSGYLSFFDTARLYTGCQLSASQQAFQNFWHDPASHEKIIRNLFSLSYAFKKT